MAWSSYRPQASIELLANSIFKSSCWRGVVHVAFAFRWATLTVAHNWVQFGVGHRGENDRHVKSCRQILHQVARRRSVLYRQLTQLAEGLWLPSGSRPVLRHSFMLPKPRHDVGLSHLCQGWL